jgi:hypothetical protein
MSICVDYEMINCEGSGIIVLTTYDNIVRGE